MMVRVGVRGGDGGGEGEGDVECSCSRRRISYHSSEGREAQREMDGKLGNRWIFLYLC